MLRSAALIALLAAMPLPLPAKTAPVAKPVVAGPASADSAQAESGQPPKRIRSVTLTGNQACPKPNNPDDEIIVCARQGEPYRIPKELRDEHPIAARNQSWVNRTAVADAAGRSAGGLPDTCSATGTGGQSGCAKLRAEQYAAEKRAAANERATVP